MARSRSEFWDRLLAENYLKKSPDTYPGLFNLKGFTEPTRHFYGRFALKPLEAFSVFSFVFPLSFLIQSVDFH